jgi:hypothetical protein
MVMVEGLREIHGKGEMIPVSMRCRTHIYIRLFFLRLLIETRNTSGKGLGTRLFII